jgi:hypothetical protein
MQERCKVLYRVTVQVQGMVQVKMLNFQTLQQVVVVATILRENQIQRQDPTPVVAFV